MRPLYGCTCIIIRAPYNYRCSSWNRSAGKIPAQYNYGYCVQVQPRRITHSEDPISSKRSRVRISYSPYGPVYRHPHSLPVINKGQELLLFTRKPHYGLRSNDGVYSSGKYVFR